MLYDKVSGRFMTNTLIVFFKDEMFKGRMKCGLKTGLDVNVGLM